MYVCGCLCVCGWVYTHASVDVRGGGEERVRYIMH